MDISEEKSESQILASRMIDGKIELIAGVRKMVGLFENLDADGQDVRDVFRGVESQTDHILLPPFDENLAPQARVRNSEELEECSAYFRQVIIEACYKILSKYDRRGSRM